MKLKAKLTKGSEVKYISHLDLMKTIQKALRRAQLPVAFSQGFNPHPKISLASALAVGVTSEGEYLEFELTAELPPEDVLDRLNRVLPRGLALTAIALAGEKDKPLMAIVNAAAYEVRFPLESIHCQDAAEKLKTFLERPCIILPKENKSGTLVNLDLRPGIWGMTLGPCQDGWASLELLVETGSRLNVKPQDLVVVWGQWASLAIDPDELLIHRRALYVREGDRLIEPLHTECR